MIGVVKHWNADKGFGFLATDSGEDVFAHITQVTNEEIDSLSKGARVSFEIAPSKKRPEKMEAKNIHVIEGHRN
jgi:CspA family cold shock protein